MTIIQGLRIVWALTKFSIQSESIVYLLQFGDFV